MSAGIGAHVGDINREAPTPQLVPHLRVAFYCWGLVSLPPSFCTGASLTPLVGPRKSVSWLAPGHLCKKEQNHGR